MQPVGIHHVSINVTDVDEATRFYTEVLGFTVRDDRPDLGIGGCWLDAGGQQVHLIESPVPPKGSGVECVNIRRVWVKFQRTLKLSGPDRPVKYRDGQGSMSVSKRIV